MTKPIANNNTTPWYLHAVQAFAAWLAAIFMLAFVAAIFDFNLGSTPLLLAFGAALLLVAGVLQKQNTEIFANHMGLAFILCGQWLIFIGFEQTLAQYPALYFALWALLQVFLLWVFKEKLTRFTLSLFLMQALLINASFYGVGFLAYWLVLGFCCWAFLQTAPSRRLLTTLALAGLLVLLLQDFWFYAFDGALWYLYPEPLFNWQPWLWLEHTLFGLWALFFIAVLFSIDNLQQSQQSKVLALVVLLLLSVLYYFLPQAMLAAVVLLLAFAKSNRILQALAVAALLFFVSRYYYYLPETLLAKSWALLQVALVLLALGALLHVFNKREVAHEKS